MRHAPALPQDRYLIQVGLVAAMTAACVLIADALAFRSPINSAWMIGLPIMVGMVANSDWTRRGFMAFALLGVSLVVGALVGVNFTSYG